MNDREFHDLLERASEFCDLMSIMAGYAAGAMASAGISYDEIGRICNFDAIRNFRRRIDRLVKDGRAKTYDHAVLSLMDSEEWADFDVLQRTLHNWFRGRSPGRIM